MEIVQPPKLEDHAPVEVLNVVIDPAVDYVKSLDEIQAILKMGVLAAGSNKELSEAAHKIPKEVWAELGSSAGLKAKSDALVEQAAALSANNPESPEIQKLLGESEVIKKHFDLRVAALRIVARWTLHRLWAKYPPTTSFRVKILKNDLFKEA